ncbi:MAG TPA: hypothetical protein GXX36_10030 [Clostridiaceae bacterium]|nr:hypothetical protein [Clostridiaceae bacterium]
MRIVVNLWSNREGEIKKFLESYYDKEVMIDNDVTKWIYAYSNPLEAVDIISAVVDNNDKYKIAVCIQADEGELHPVTSENHNDVVKGLFQLFYNPTAEPTHA